MVHGAGIAQGEAEPPAVHRSREVEQMGPLAPVALLRGGRQDGGEGPRRPVAAGVWSKRPR
ncbi:hypothetical protein O1L44_07805 [Streptomyces noursei]|nr:hypothetical protein [Streptomyces noursei]